MNMTEIFKKAYESLGRGVKIKLYSGGVIYAKLTKIVLTPAPLHICYTDSEGYHDSISILEIEGIEENGER